MTWFHAARARLRLLSRRAAESRFDSEIRFHVEMETERLMRDEKLDASEARRRALAAFGGVEQHREALRDGRGTAWFSGLSLDLKLGVRMLVKYPGLTVVGGLAMAFGIWFGAVTFQMFGLLTTTNLPLADGDRIVKIQNLDVATLQDEDRVLYDYQRWRTARSITDLGAYRNVGPNLVGADSIAQPVAGAEVTASAFRVAPAQPLLGRVIVESDADASAAPVALLGHDVWVRRFNSDPMIVGRNVQIGSGYATVIGVMPDGYAFPVSHEMWLPLRTNGADAEPRRGVEITVFGRLADGMTLENAQEELAGFGRRMAAEHPGTHAHIQPHVIPYAQMGIDNGDMMKVKMLTYVFIVVLVIVVCCTVALLLFARAASRESEIIVRAALGASRRRIVAQLFAEALVLSGVAVVVGLAAAQLTLSRLGEPYIRMNYDFVPFWFNFNLSPSTIIVAVALALIGAVVAGVMPARKITRGLGTHLRAGTAGGGGVSFGGVWTGVIIVQVALTVLFPSVVMLVHGESTRIATYDFGFAKQEYLGVSLGIDGPAPDTATPEVNAALRARFVASLEALRQRLEPDAGVAGVTFVDRLPGDYHIDRQVELVPSNGTSPAWVETARVDPSYFAVLETPMIAGRAFTSGDLAPDARVVIVDQGFADLVMPGQYPVGHQIRMSTGKLADSIPAEWPWYEIVGVVKKLGMSHFAQRDLPAGVYMPVIPGSQGMVNMIVHGRGDPVAIAPRVRDVARAVDPDLRVEQITPLDELAAPFLWFLGLWQKIIIGLTGVALLLSLAGIYAVLSYAVARRTREIGIRVGLGANSRRVITSIFRRPLTQVTMGVMTGILLIFVASTGLRNSTEFKGSNAGVSAGDIGLLAGYAVLMLCVCLLACIVPTIRALRVQPTEALRAE